MLAHETDVAGSGYSDPAPVFVAATSDAALQQAERSVRASGLRVAARLPLEQARDRLDLQAAASAIWIEIDRDCGAPMDELLRLVSRDAGAQRYAAVVSACGWMLDTVAACVEESAVELIIDADDSERVAALALAIVRRPLPLSISDVSRDRGAERLRQLSDEVSRIAATLARLSTGPGAPPSAIAEAAPLADLPPLSAESVREVIRARRLRAQFFDEELFADPAWDMMLDLLQAEIAQLRVPVSSLCIAAAVPATTALRWLKMLVSKGLFIRRADPHDGRRVFVELAPVTSEKLRRYFAQAQRVAVI